MTCCCYSLEFLFCFLYSPLAFLFTGEFLHKTLSLLTAEQHATGGLERWEVVGVITMDTRKARHLWPNTRRHHISAQAVSTAGR